VLVLQQNTGIDVLTDGEFRRSDFRAGLADAVEGMLTTTGLQCLAQRGGDKAIPVKFWHVAGKLQQKRRITEHEASFLPPEHFRARQVTLISPGFMAGRSFNPA